MLPWEAAKPSGKTGGVMRAEEEAAASAFPVPSQST